MHVGSRRRFGALLAGAALLPVLAASPAAAAGIVVNSKTMLTQDDGTCTLPEAIKAANTDTASGASTGECAAGFGADDMITFSVSGTIYTTRLPDITQGVTINGGNKVTLNAQGGSSFFIANASGIYLFNIVFTNGRAPVRRRDPRRRRRRGLSRALHGEQQPRAAGWRGHRRRRRRPLRRRLHDQRQHGNAAGRWDPPRAGLVRPDRPLDDQRQLFAVRRRRVRRQHRGAGHRELDHREERRHQHRWRASTSGQNVGLTISNSTIALNSASTSLGGLYADYHGERRHPQHHHRRQRQGQRRRAAIDTSVSEHHRGLDDRPPRPRGAPGQRRPDQDDQAPVDGVRRAR